MKPQFDWESYAKTNCSIPDRLLYLSGAIDEESGSEFIKAVMAMTSTPEPFDLFINSHGGDYYQALAMYEILKLVPNKVIAFGIGQVFSAAALIMQGADEAYVTPECTVLIHAGTTGQSGNHEEFQAWAEEYKRSHDKMIDLMWEAIRKRKPGTTRETVASWLSKETIMTAGDAVARGLADAILPYSKPEGTAPSQLGEVKYVVVKSKNAARSRSKRTVRGRRK